MDQAPTSSQVQPPASERGIAALRRLVALADGMIGTVRIMTVACLAAGVWCWVAIFAPFRFSVFTAPIGIITLLITLAPGVVLVLFHWGLQEVRKTPARIDELRRQGMDGARELWASVRNDPEAQQKRGIWRLLRGLWEVRSLADEARGLAFQYLAIVRLANPVTALAVAIAIGASAGLAAIAAIVTAVRLV